VLFVAYHYPPIAVSSGVHRTLAFTRYLKEWGWDVTVLTADYNVYPRFDLDQLNVIPEGVNVIRAWAKDTARDLSIKGRYSQWMAIPDRYQSWIIGGVLSGLKAIRKGKPNVIVSTYPIASAHIIAYFLHRLTGIPWVADFRDPMAQEGYPDNPLVRKSFLWVEKQAIKYAAKLVFVTPGARDYYLERYPDATREKFLVIANGFDEKVFEETETLIAKRENTASTNITESSELKTFLHSGVIYPSERDPKDLFAAIKELLDEGAISKQTFQLVLRASGHEAQFQPVIDDLGITDIVRFEPPIPYQSALSEMYDVDVLLVLQADNCELQIPAKAYEYIRVGKPILGLTTHTGETGKLLQSVPNCLVAPLDNKDEIKVSLISMLNQESSAIQSDDYVSGFSRKSGAKKLEMLLSEFVA